MNRLRQRVPLKKLSAARQELIMCMHQKQFGTIRKLAIVNGEPKVREAIVTRRCNLTRAPASKPISRNVILKDAHLRLLESLDEIQNGVLELIVFREGLPCEVEQDAA